MRGHRLQVATLAAALTAGLAGWCAWHVVPSRGPAHDLTCVLLREWRRDEVLERRQRLLELSNKARSGVAAEVIAGRVTLAEAVRSFRDIDDARDDDGGDVLRPLRSPATEKGEYLRALSWVKAELRGHPRAAIILAPLEEEYRQRFGDVPSLGPSIPDILFRPAPPPAALSAGGDVTHPPS
jgi:hypothetical protein